MIPTKAFQTLFFLFAFFIMLGATVDAVPAPSKDGCIKCFAPPICPPCTKLEKCEITPASCHDCGSGKCVPLHQDGCIQCFAPPICPPCTKLEKCEITPASCDDCGSGKCVPL